MKRKVLALLLSVSAALNLAACGGGRTETPVQESVPEVIPIAATPPRTVRAGLILSGSDGDADAESSPFLLGRADADMSLSAKNIQVTWDVRYAPDEEACEEAGRALAEGGCQAEMGTASAMAAGALCQANSGCHCTAHTGRSRWNMPSTMPSSAQS